jgi:phosphoribosylformimino-5-aminoimidazole carboxamide ribotide isomerase
MLKRENADEGPGPGGGSERGARERRVAAEAIPAIDVLGGHVVRLRQGRYDRVERYPTDAVALAETYRRAGARWLHVIDLDAARDGARSPEHAETLRRVAALGLHLQLGGGVRSRADVEWALGLGAERVLVGTLAARDPALVGRLAVETGRIAVAADVRAGRVRAAGWLEDTGVAASDFVDRLAGAGVRDFLVTAIERDGTGAGPDLELLASLRPLVPGALAAAGGVGMARHVADAVGAGADAVVVGRALLDGAFTFAEARAAAAQGGGDDTGSGGGDDPAV